MYGSPREPAIEFTMILSLNGRNITVNTTDPAGGVLLMYYSDNMGVGDHQLSGHLTVPRGFPVGIDYFECVVPLSQFVQELGATNLVASRIENSSGDPFDLRSQCRASCAAWYVQ